MLQNLFVGGCDGGWHFIGGLCCLSTVFEDERGMVLMLFVTGEEKEGGDVERRVYYKKVENEQNFHSFVVFLG